MYGEQWKLNFFIMQHSWSRLCNACHGYYMRTARWVFIEQRGMYTRSIHIEKCYRFLYGSVTTHFFAFFFLPLSPCLWLGATWSSNHVELSVVICGWVQEQCLGCEHEDSTQGLMGLAPTREGFLKKSLDHTLLMKWFNLIYCPQHHTSLHELVPLGWNLYSGTLVHNCTGHPMIIMNTLNTMSTHTECYHQRLRNQPLNTPEWAFKISL
jgi:hypothetical protein